MKPSTKCYALSPKPGDLPGLKWLGAAYIAASILNPRLDQHTIEIFSGACPRCRETRMFAGYDMGYPTATMCFYCEVTAEHERDSGWHPDIAEAIAQAEEAAAFFTPRPIAERAESKLAGLQARAEKAEARDAEQWSQVHTLLVQAVAERDEMKAELAQARATAGRRLDEVRSLEAELAELKAQRKAEHKHSLQRAIIATLETMSTMWPKGEAPSSRL
jgi:hypothetical protein